MPRKTFREKVQKDFRKTRERYPNYVDKSIDQVNQTPQPNSDLYSFSYTPNIHKLKSSTSDDSSMYNSIRNDMFKTILLASLALTAEYLVYLYFQF